MVRRERDDAGRVRRTKTVSKRAIRLPEKKSGASKRREKNGRMWRQSKKAVWNFFPQGVARGECDLRCCIVLLVSVTLGLYQALLT